MRGSKAAAKALRKARKIMNDGGKHWIKGALQGPSAEDGKPTYCYAGGIQAAMFGGLNEAHRTNRWAKPSYVEAVIASARAIGYTSFKKTEARYERALKSPVYADRMMRPFRSSVSYDSGVTTLRQAFAASVESDIFRFNDGAKRKWSEVDAMLAQAAASLEVEEHGLGAE